jgi:protein required for attachment to host cells
MAQQEALPAQPAGLSHWYLRHPSLTAVKARRRPADYRGPMSTTPPPDWILIANATRARVLQQEAGGAMEVLESFVHPAGRGQPVEPITDPREKSYTRFAHELAQHVEQDARQGHLCSLVIFAPQPFLDELVSALGKAGRRLLCGAHELDLTSVGLAELDWRIQHELEAAAH